jgi:signal peptidase I
MPYGLECTEHKAERLEPMASSEVDGGTEGTRRNNTGRAMLKMVGKAALNVLQTGVEAAALFVIISLLVGRFEIHSVSMEPNLHEGQRVLVNKLDRLWPTWLVGSAEASEGSGSSPFAPQRGQVVVFYATLDHTGTPLVKRAIGLPGESIQFKDGRVLVNGQAIDEPYINGLQTTCNSYCSPVTLGPDEYWMMGDNRPNSRDSRSFGPVHASQLIGQVVVRYWPLDQLAVYR